MGQFVENALENDIECFAFGDLFLEDVRNYRIKNLKDTGIDAIFPIWGIPTDKLSRKMIANGVKAILTCIDPKQLSEEFAGKEYNNELLNTLPETVDPCGENGEFHSFVYDCPGFKEKIDIKVGEIVNRDGFVFADVFEK